MKMLFVFLKRTHQFLDLDVFLLNVGFYQLIQVYYLLLNLTLDLQVLRVEFLVLFVFFLLDLVQKVLLSTGERVYQLLRDFFKIILYANGQFMTKVRLFLLTPI